MTAILLFAEVIPQALCSRYGLQIGSFFAPVVRGLMIVCYPLAKPISLALDYILGELESGFYRRAQIRAIVELHGEMGRGERQGGWWRVDGWMVSSIKDR